MPFMATRGVIHKALLSLPRRRGEVGGLSHIVSAKQPHSQGGTESVCGSDEDVQNEPCVLLSFSILKESFINPIKQRFHDCSLLKCEKYYFHIQGFAIFSPAEYYLPLREVEI